MVYSFFLRQYITGYIVVKDHISCTPPRDILATRNDFITAHPSAWVNAYFKGMTLVFQWCVIIGIVTVIWGYFERSHRHRKPHAMVAARWPSFRRPRAGLLSPIFRPDWSEWAATLFWYGRTVLELHICWSQWRQTALNKRPETWHHLILNVN